MPLELFPRFVIGLVLFLALAACSDSQADQLETPSPLSTLADADSSAGAASETDSSASPARETDSSASTPLPPTIPPVDDTSGVIIGRVDNTTGPLPDGVYIWVIELRRSVEGFGIFALNTLTTPSFPVERNGYFQAYPIEPGEYVLVVGITPEEAVALVREDGQARPYDVVGGEVLDIGTETIALTLPPPVEERPTAGYPAPQQTAESAYP